MICRMTKRQREALRELIKQEAQALIYGEGFDPEGMEQAEEDFNRAFSNEDQETDEND